MIVVILWVVPVAASQAPRLPMHITMTARPVSPGDVRRRLCQQWGETPSGYPTSRVF